jgi:hypothetical protein
MSFGAEHNIDPLVARMQQAPQIVKEEMIRGVNEMAMAGQAQAMKLVGVKTGHLRRSITTTKATFAGGTVTASYGTNVPYARFHEEGRGPIVARPGRVLRFTINGKVLFRKRVGPAKGRRFFKGSLDWLRPQVARHARVMKQRIVNRLGG